MLWKNEYLVLAAAMFSLSLLDAMCTEYLGGASIETNPVMLYAMQTLGLGWIAAKQLLIVGVIWLAYKAKSVFVLEIGVVAFLFVCIYHYYLISGVLT